MSSIEVVRRIDPSVKLNQRLSKKLFERQQRLGPTLSKKAQRSEERKAQDKKFVRDWIARESELRLSPKQRFELALGRGSDRDVEFLFSQADEMGKFGYQADTYTFPESATDTKTE